MKKMFALCLAFAMLLTVLAGCKKTEPGADLNEPQTTVTTPDNTAQQDANPTTDDDDSWKEEHPTWLCKDKTTLTVYTWEGVSSNYLPPSNELFFWQYMEDYTNVHIEWEVVPYADFDTLIAAKLASGGKMNDILMMGNIVSTANDAGYNGIIIDLLPLWDTCFTNIQAEMDRLGVSYKQNISNPDGSCYAIATLGAPIENRVMLMFNTLWMKQLGLEIPTTLEELDEVLRALKAGGDLNGNGLDDEIILTSPGVETLIASVNAAYGMEALNDEPRFAADENGVVYDEYTCENQKELLRWLNGMYDEGILDPEITVNSMDVVSEKVAADRVGVMAFYSSFASVYGNLTPAGQENRNTELYTLGLPMTSEWSPVAHMMMYEYYGMFTGISADCQTPEIAARWLDTLYADPNILITRCCGQEGVTYEMVDGEPKIILPEDDPSDWNIGPLGCGQISLPYVQTDLQLLFNKTGTTPWYVEQYANLRENYEWWPRSVHMIPSFTDDEAFLRDTYYADLRAGWQEYRDKFITGVLDVDADWDTYVRSMNALGLQEMIECYQSVYDRTH